MMHFYDGADRPNFCKRKLLSDDELEKLLGNQRAPSLTKTKNPVQLVVLSAKKIAKIGYQILINSLRCSFKAIIDAIHPTMKWDNAVKMGLLTIAYWAKIAQEVSSLLHPSLQAQWREFDAFHPLINLTLDDVRILIGNQRPNIAKKGSWGVQKVQLIRLLFTATCASIAYRLQSALSIYLSQIFSQLPGGFHSSSAKLRLNGLQGAISAHCAAARAFAALFGLCFNDQGALGIIITIHVVQQSLKAQVIASTSAQGNQMPKILTSKGELLSGTMARSRSDGYLIESQIRKEIQDSQNATGFLKSAGNSPNPPKSKPKDVENVAPTSPRRQPDIVPKTLFKEENTLFSSHKGTSLQGIKQRHVEVITVSAWA